MPNMGRYCKAYLVKSLREFAGWTENAANAQPDDGPDAEEGAAPRTITEDDFLYLQENYVVTDGIFIDENIIFDSVTPEWIDFCRKALEFEVPEYAKAPEAGAEPERVAVTA
ncbi:MAG TPA: hypothetical protein VN228_07170 [Pyrinomonadaceae bacterium]|nr:hypothetical protein [Pyrinomonadaceae bacterium]